MSWLIGMLSAIFLSSANIYFTQQEQTKQIAKLTQQFEKFTDGSNASAQQLQELKFKYLDLERRVDAAERQIQRPVK